ncbi:MAG: FecR domain-containing protein [Spirochaetes bacterium]|nr:FecR domain-containing protein [Spirochaetota bacterium]
MKKVFIMPVLMAVAISVTTCKKADQEMVTVQFSVGNAKILSAGGEKAAAAGAVISYNDSIVTGAASFVDLNFGTRGVIRIVENSTVKMAALKTADGADQAQFDLDKGKILVVMAKLSKEAGFTVKTRTTIAAIRGTSFMVVSDPKDSRVYVLKGKILVQLVKEGKLAGTVEKMLEANKKVIVSEDLVDQIVAGKKDLEVAALTPKETADIKKELKDIKAGEKLDAEAKKELTEMTSDSDSKAGGVKGPGPVKQKDAPQDIQSLPAI